MTYGPKESEDRLRRVAGGWEQLHPEKSFGGMTLAQFKAGIDPSFSVRTEIDQAETHLKSLYAEREHADDASLAKVQLVVNGVLADPDLGPDSALYEAFGYTRKSDRQSGLTRKHEKPPEK
jgi:hypothetical protein